MLNDDDIIMQTCFSNGAQTCEQLSWDMRKFVQGFECNSATTHIQATEGPWGILYCNVSTLVSDRWGHSGLLYHSAHETHSLLSLILGMIQINNKTADVNNAFGIIPSWEQRFAGHVQKTFVAQVQQ